MLKQERKAGASVAALAKKHGVTPSYIYQIG
jgi:transposase-like protein